MKTNETPYCYRYPHPALTADCVIFGFDGQSLKILLVERGRTPYLGSWALPGGFMRMDETIEQCAARELAEETNLKGIYLEQFKVFSTVKRDPRERVVTVAFVALVRPHLYEVSAGDDASDARWFDLEFMPPMAFDHADIVAQARMYISEMLRVKPIAFELLNKVFSLSELQRVYEAITGHSYDRRNFQRKALQSGIIKEVDGSAPRMEACAAPPPSRPGRNSRKFFKLRNRLLAPHKEEEAEEDASIKDLFNF